MGHLKGSAIQTIKKHLKEQSLEEIFMTKLSAAGLSAYRKTLPASWLPIPEAIEIIEQAAPLIYPVDAKERFRRLGQEAAQEAIPGIYRMFLRIPTVKFMLSNSPTLWRTYWDVGELSVESQTDASAIFKITHATEFTPELREFCMGYAQGTLGLTQIKNAKVVDGGWTPEVWRLHATWE